MYENIFNFISAKNNDSSQDLNKATYSSDLVNQIISRYFTAGQTVLDNFSGTGTTMYACIQNGIKSIGIELSKAQCEYTVKRLNTIQQKLF